MSVELRRLKPHLEFPWKVGKDTITFFVKAESSEDDRMCVAFAPKGGQRCRELVRCMVVGWKGVDADGAPVPYEFELLELLPRGEGNLFLELGRFILEKTDVVKETKETKALKKD